LPPATRDLLRARPALQVFNLHHNAAPTAEMAVGLLLAAARRLVPCDQALRRGDWRPRYATDRGLLLDGARAVVLGYGAIGRRVAVALRALGMDVDAIRRGGTGVEEADGVHVWPVARLDERLDGAHVLVLAVPLTDATRELIDGPRLDRLGTGAILVNVARGAVLDEEALFARLRDGRLGGAGLDVWWRYPSDAESREATAPSALDFGALENVVLSPHRAGHVDATEGLRARHLARVLAALASGDVPPGRVDLDAGY
jgi:phosphoglycerate dehydrogenase-like enzyme